MNDLHGIVLVVLILSVCIVVVFRIKNFHSRRAFKLKMSSLYSEIKGHQQQINYRVSCLNCYNFLQYNLKESLLVQEQIQLWEGIRQSIIK